MAKTAELKKRRQAILKRIRALKQEIRDKEPTLDDIARFVQENHPKKQEQRIVEEQLRQAQSELDDIGESSKRTVL
jgi:hypothetical protein